LYERPDKGQKYVSCIECEKYCDDTSDALRHIRKWIISVAESDDNILQKKLLSLIAPTLAIFNNEIMEKNYQKWK